MILEETTQCLMQDFDFENLLQPHSMQDFFSKYWEKQPLLIHRNLPAYYQALFSVDDVDQILDLNRPSGSSLRVVKNQEPLLPSSYENQNGSLNLNKLYAAYADGYTININEIQRFWQPLRMLCQKTSNSLSHQTVANMYLTPKNQKALLPHYDTHDVFVIQVYGKKHWKTYDSPVETPLLHSFQPVFKREQLRNEQERTIHAGDLMYMPRGVPHEAYTTDEPSLHITLGVHPAQWVDLIVGAIKQLSYSTPALRKALPPGFLDPSKQTQEFRMEIKEKFSELLEMAAEKANCQGAVMVLSEEFRKHRSLIGDGHFRQLDDMAGLSLETYCERRAGLTCTTQQAGSVARIAFPGNIIKGPAHIFDALNFVATKQGRFLLNELPNLSDANRLQLAKKLIRGGVLRSCS